MSRLVTEKMVRDAFDWMDENAGPAAHARAERIRAEHGVKKARARSFLESTGTVAEREAKALASQAYEEASEIEIQAVGRDEWMRNQRNKCEAIIEAWRTECSNLRGMGKVA